MVKLPKAVLKGAKAIPANASRTYTGRLYFDGRTAVVTDGHVLFYVRLEDEANGLQGRYLDVERLKAADVELEVDATGAIVARQPKSMDVQPAEETPADFPKWRTLLPGAGEWVDGHKGPEGHVFLAGFSPEVLRMALAGFDGESIRFYIRAERGADNALVIRGKSGGLDATVLVMPQRVDKGDR